MFSGAAEIVRRRTQTVPRAKSRAMQRAAYNSRIPYMLVPLSSRSVGFALLALALLLAIFRYRNHLLEFTQHDRANNSRRI